MVVIIGAGPVGCYLGYLLASKGISVDIYEEHLEVGRPLQCTGIMSKNLGSIIDITSDFWVHSAYGAKLYSPDGKFVELHTKGLSAYILSRPRFDRYWADMAVKAGCKLFLGHKFVGFSDGIVRFKSGLEVKTDVLVGADGPLSPVAKSVGIYGDRKLWRAGQATIKVSGGEDIVKVYMGSVCPDFFAWSVPEGKDLFRVGLASEVDSAKLFRELANSVGGEIVEYQGGLIPYHDSKLKIEKDNVYLVGDAATQVKATTGGGVVHGFLAAQELCSVIINGEKSGSYTKRCKKKIGRELWLTVLLRKYMNRMKDKDWNFLVKLFNSGRAAKVLEKYGDMDFPSKFLFRLVLSEPRFLLFSKLLFRR